MGTGLCIFIVILILILFFSSTVGILLPHYFFNVNIVVLQVIFTSLLVILTTFLTFYLINRKLSFLHEIVDKMDERNTDLIIIRSNKKHIFKNISYCINNLEKIILNYNHTIKEQSTILNKYSLVNSKLERANQVRDVMLAVSNSVLEISDTEKFFKLILEKLIDIIVDADKGSFMVLNDNNLLEYKAAIGFNIFKLKGIKVRLEETFLWKKNSGNITKPCIIKDIRSFDSHHLNNRTYTALDNIKALDIKTTLSIPIIIDNELYGMINIDSLNIDAFNEEDLLVAEYFSNQISIAIKNHQLIERIIYLSKYDSMTNAYNRCYFEKLLDEFYRKAYKYNEAFCLVMMDLNSLKYINDTFGHTVGDMVISEFAKAIKNNTRTSDLFARYGGDEFIGIFCNCSSSDIENRLLNIMKYFKNNPLEINGSQVIITFSYGIAYFPEESKDINEIIKLADKRMYDYKKIFYQDYKN